MPAQHTVAGRVGCTGQALHLGHQVEMTLAPAPPDSGIAFKRVDLPGAPSVRASVESVVDTRRCVAVGLDGWRVGTVEHLLAAAHGLGVDNLIVEVDGEELPAGDGSALFFVDLLQRAGLAVQEKQRRVQKIGRAIWVAENDSYLIVLPPERPGLTISFTFSADSRAIGAQYLRFRLGDDDFVRDIAPARTVAFLEEIETLRSEGLARCDDTKMAVLVGPEGYLNALRLPDEIVRHKILDLLGDLFLLGPVHGCVVAVRSGHRLNHRLAQALRYATPTAALEDAPGTVARVRPNAYE